jgi:hypothetical protein
MRIERENIWVSGESLFPGHRGSAANAEHVIVGKRRDQEGLRCNLR